jgi:hypothetical protein
MENSVSNQVVSMKNWIPTLLSELHKQYLKPLGFTKVRQTVSRDRGGYQEHFNFQSSRSNFGDERRFHLNVEIKFNDLDAGTQYWSYLTGGTHWAGWPRQLVKGAPEHWDCNPSTNRERLKEDLRDLILKASQRLAERASELKAEYIGRLARLRGRSEESMTEAEWLACTDPQPMLDFLRETASDRKLRLFACACCRHVLHLLTDRHVCRRTIEFAERFADGLATKNELHENAWGKSGEAGPVVLWKARDAAEDSARYGAAKVQWAVLGSDPEKCKAWEEAFRAAWEDYSGSVATELADAAMPPEWVAMGKSAWSEEEKCQSVLLRDIFGNPFHPVVLDAAWLTPSVVELAQSVYDSQDFSTLPKLAHALEETGCTNAEILNHCRGPGPHVRGCWMVDLLVGKE